MPTLDPPTPLHSSVRVRQYHWGSSVPDLTYLTYGRVCGGGNVQWALMRPVRWQVGIAEKYERPPSIQDRRTYGIPTPCVDRQRLVSSTRHQRFLDHESGSKAREGPTPSMWLACDFRRLYPFRRPVK